MSERAGAGMPPSQGTPARAVLPAYLWMGQPPSFLLLCPHLQTVLGATGTWRGPSTRHAAGTGHGPIPETQATPWLAVSWPWPRQGSPEPLLPRLWNGGMLVP